MRQKVIVVGAGVGGLTAAHELVERGFDVHVFERRDFAGGKAASVRIDIPSVPRGERLPGEHGFRFFPSWYRHLPDTLKRIPFRGRRTYFEGATVYDNLVAADVNLLTWYGRDPSPLPMHLPRNTSQLGAFAEFATELRNFGLAQSEVTFFLGKLLNFLMMSEEMRVQRFQDITWWDYVEASSKSPAYQSLVSATTRTMVAAKATQACAYTIGRLALRTLFDSVTNVDRVLNGPTNEVWIDPWVEHLRNRGVTFHFGTELESIDFSGRDPCVDSLSFSWTLANDLGRLRSLLAVWSADVFADDDATRNPGEMTDTARRRRRASLITSTKPIKLLLDSLLTRIEALKAGRDPDAARDLDGIGIKPEFFEEVEGELRTFESMLEVFQSELAREGAQRALRARERRETGALTATPQPDEDVASISDTFGGAWLAFVDGLGYSKALAAVAKRLATAQVLTALCESRLPPIPPAMFGGPPLDADYWRDLRIAVAMVQSPGSAVRQLEARLKDFSVGPADYFVMSLPVEQLAYYVNRSGTITLHDPGLERIVRLADATDWMAGVQFYLEQPIRITAGHIIGMDSEWGLTAVEQTQFWKDISIPDNVKSVISVDVAAWDRPGRDIRKEAFNCSDEELAIEVWAQLKAGLNRATRQWALRDAMLVGGGLQQNVSYHVDDSIVDVFDRKKQGAYERARSVRFSQVAPERQDAAGAPPPLTTPYVWGPRLRYNAEPLLVNRVGTHALRPEAKTRITNLFLASDYVKTETDLACMEGANEAARRAVNALLDAAGSTASRCELWQFMSATGVAETFGKAIGMAGANPAAVAIKNMASIADGAIGMATQATATLRRFWERK